MAAAIINIAIIRACSICIRGTRRKPHSATLIGFEDGTGILTYFKEFLIGTAKILQMFIDLYTST